MERTSHRSDEERLWCKQDTAAAVTIYHHSSLFAPRIVALSLSEC